MVPDGPKRSAANKIIGILKLGKQPKPNVKKTGRWLSSFVKSKTYHSPLALLLAAAGSVANQKRRLLNRFTLSMRHEPG